MLPSNQINENNEVNEDQLVITPLFSSSNENNEADDSNANTVNERTGATSQLIEESLDCNVETTDNATNNESNQSQHQALNTSDSNENSNQVNVSSTSSEGNETSAVNESNNEVQLTNQVEEIDSPFYQIFICPICQAEYCSETGDPMTLVCGHSICYQCMEEISESFSDSVCCPTCRVFTKQEYYPSKSCISHTMKTLIKKYKERTGKIKQAMPLEEHKINHSKQTVCKKHGLPFHFGCIPCKQFLCGKCTCYSHSGTDTKCEVFPINESMIRLSKIVQKDLSKLENEIKDKRDKEMAQLLESIEELIAEFNPEKAIKEQMDRLKKKKNTYNSQKENLVTYISQTIAIKNNILNASALKDFCGALRHYREQKLCQRRISNNGYFRWKKWIKDGLRLYPKLKSFSLEREGKQCCVKVEVHDNDEVRMLQTNARGYGCPRLNEAFFSLDHHPYFAYIDIGFSDSNKVELRLKFRIDDCPLGDGFLLRCSQQNEKRSFTGSSFILPFKHGSYVFFGKTPTYSTCRILRNLIAEAPTYKKPLIKGAIGLYNHVDENGTLNLFDMNVYINLESEMRHDQILPYIAYQTRINFQLKYCFGQVIEGLEDLENLVRTYDKPLEVIDCGIRFSNL